MRVVHAAAVVTMTAFLSACGGGSSGSPVTTNGAVPPTNTGAGSNGNGNNASPSPSIQVQITEITVPTTPDTLAVSDSGVVYFGSSIFNGHGIYQYNGSNFVHTVAYNINTGCPEDTTAECPTGVDAIDASGLPRVLWASYYIAITVENFGSDGLEYGATGGTAARPPTSIIPANACCFPFIISSMITSRSGNVWLAGQSDPSNFFPVGYPIGDKQLTAYAGPLLFANGPDNNVWGGIQANGLGNTTTIFEFSANGTLLHTLPVPPGTQLSAIAGTSDAIWFTDPNHNAIARLSKQGTLNEYPIPTPNSRPFGITLASDNAIWFTEYNTSKVGRIDSAGHILEFELPTSNAAPQTIAASPPGCSTPNVLWVAETNTNNTPKLAKVTFH
jgi:hypothetical protein